MTSYLPPREILTTFNTSVFDSDLTNNEIDTKIKTLDKFKLESISNQYMEVARIDTPSGVIGGTVTFTRPFNKTPDVITQVISNSSTALQSIKVHNINKISFDYLGRRDTGSAINNTAADFMYMAVGDR